MKKKHTKCGITNHRWRIRNEWETKFDQQGTCWINGLMNILAQATIWTASTVSAATTVSTASAAADLTTPTCTIPTRSTRASGADSIRCTRRRSAADSDPTSLTTRPLTGTDRWSSAMNWIHQPRLLLVAYIIDYSTYNSWKCQFHFLVGDESEA